METRYRGSVATPNYPSFGVRSRFPPSYPAYAIDGISRLTWWNDAYELVLEKLLGKEHLPKVEVGKTSLFQVLYHPELRVVMGREWENNVERKIKFLKPIILDYIVPDSDIDAQWQELKGQLDQLPQFCGWWEKASRLQDPKILDQEGKLVVVYLKYRLLTPGHTLEFRNTIQYLTVDLPQHLFTLVPNNDETEIALNFMHRN